MKKIEVTASQELHELRLDGLVGKKGMVLDMNKSNTGAYVKLDEAWNGYTEWFIPKQSLKRVEE